MANYKVPQSKEELFKMIDRHLGPSGRKELLEAEDLTDFHFGLGTWIRNRFVYPMGEDVYRLLHEGDEFIFVPLGDMMSEEILEAYKAYLIEKQ